MLFKIFRLIRTVGYLKFVQLIFRFVNPYIFYPIRLRKPKTNTLNNFNVILNPNSTFLNYSFLFLNIKHRFGLKINWDYKNHGMLWIFNLNYFDFINQDNLNKEQSIYLIYDFADNYKKCKIGKHPYTTSLRIINLVKFVTNQKLKDQKIDDQLWIDTSNLYHKVEYHLLGNHVLENAFALWFAGHYFNNKMIQSRGVRLILKELQEQILNDGGHFEQSPMYHCIILGRLLECISLAKQNPQDWNKKTLPILERISSKMLGWLDKIRIENDILPLVNDSVNEIGPKPSQLFKIAEELRIRPLNSTLGPSGYRNIRLSDFNLFIDIGNIEASYQPGHTHADTFNTLLWYKSQPILTEGGTSTYENNERRSWERSTAAHNTVSVNGINSSETWSSFRVGRRACVQNQIETDQKIKCNHNGFSHLGTIHTRTWEWTESTLKITDEMNMKNYVRPIAHFHFHPNCDVQLTDNTILINNKIKITFVGHTKLYQLEYFYAQEFNKLIKGIQLNVYFKKTLTTNIILE